MERTSPALHTVCLASLKSNYEHGAGIETQMQRMPAHRSSMQKLSARTILVYIPLTIFVTIFVIARLVPRALKLEIYGFFFSDFLWLCVPYAIIALGFCVARVRARRWFSAAWAMLTCCLALTTVYARFVESEQIVVRESKLTIGAPLRIALIADLHIGLFQGAERTQQIVNALNALDVDVVAVAGDWTYEPARPLAELFAPLAQIRHRVISVPGNHDEEEPGPPLATELRTALVANRVEPIEGRVVIVNGVRIVGIGDRWARKDIVPNLAESDAPTVALAHNPDSIIRLAGTPIKTLLAGHTHGGQINVPLLTRRVLNGSTKGAYKAGLYKRLDRQIFVTSGIGMTGVPLRLFQPPVIDVLICR
jgi:uncharacterized protein